MQADVNLPENLGLMATLEQMVKVLGFHDMGSFFLASILCILSLAFIITFIIVLIKKGKERKESLRQIVEEVQKPLFKHEESLPTPEEPWPKREEILPKDEKPLPSKTAEAQKTPLEQPPAEVAPPSIPEQSHPDIITIKPEEELPRTPLEQKPSEPAKELPSVSVEEPSTVSKEVPLGAALKNTRTGFMAKLVGLFAKKATISDQDFEAIEEILFTADIGTKTAQKLLNALRSRVQQEKVQDKTAFFTILKQEMVGILHGADVAIPPSTETPRVIMFVGVNGAGKTTSIGKLGARFKSQGKNVVFGAGDTFRAAAVKQLAIWGERVQAEVVSGKENADPASVLFETIERAKALHADIALCDTAGRLHTKSSLMEELKKVHRVVAKAMPGAPHEVLLVIDATMGQNAIAQAREFAQSTPLTGIVLSKLDGTAKGGVAVGIVDELKIPILYIGIGEQPQDLRDFDAEQFVDALFMDVDKN